MKHIGGIFLLLAVLLNLATVISGMEKRKNKKITLPKNLKLEPKLIRSQSEQEVIDNKDHERIQSASCLKVVSINRDASHMLQVMTIVRNHIAIHNQVAVYDAAQDLNYAQAVIRKTVEVVDGLDRLAKL